MNYTGCDYQTNELGKDLVPVSGVLLIQALGISQIWLHPCGCNPLRRIWRFFDRESSVFGTSISGPYRTVIMRHCGQSLLAGSSSWFTTIFTTGGNHRYKHLISIRHKITAIRFCIIKASNYVTIISHIYARWLGKVMFVARLNGCFVGFIKGPRWGALTQKFTESWGSMNSRDSKEQS